MHIFFDLDRTLWDFDTNSRSCLEELYKEYKLDELQRDVSRFIDDYTSINKTLWASYREGNVSKDDLRITRFQKALQNIGYNDQQGIKEISEKYLERCPMLPGLIPEAQKTVQELSKSFSVHILTNGFRKVQLKKLSNTGIGDFVDQVITSEDAQTAKPNKEIFDYAMKVTGAGSDDSIMIGDSHDVDVIGARQMGWKTIWFDTEDSDHQHLADYRVTSLSQIPDVTRQWLQEP